MKKVHNREMVAHIWANGAQDEARTAAGNFFFTGPALFSYGSHFVVGYRYAPTPERVLFIMNGDSYSMTTGRHVAAARSAIRHNGAAIYVTGLKRDTFTGQSWRQELARDILAQAGRKFETAANTARRSMKRDGMVSAARALVAAAQTFAGFVLADADASAQDKATARQTMKTAASVPAFDSTSNDTEKATASAAAAHLVRDEMRAEMLRYAERARAYASAADHEQIAWAWDKVRSGALVADKARDIAKRYRFRVPAMPDFAPILAALEPRYMAHRAEEETRRALSCLRNAERAARALRRGVMINGRVRHGRSAYDVVRYAKDGLDFAGNANASRPDTVPAWIIARLETLQRRYTLRDMLGDMADEPRALADMIAETDAMLAGPGAGAATMAIPRYRTALNRMDKLAAVCRMVPASHPLRAASALVLADRLRVSSIVADAARLIEQAQAERITAWRAGSTVVRLPHDIGPLLRIVGERIETSWGAEVPARVAPALWRAVTQARAGAATSAAIGMRVGHFTLNAIAADGALHIGCHVIAYDELRRLAVTLGYVADDSAAVA